MKWQINWFSNEGSKQRCEESDENDMLIDFKKNTRNDVKKLVA